MAQPASPKKVALEDQQSSSWAPIMFSLQGPNREYMLVAWKVVGYITFFLKVNIDWLKETTGQRILLIKIPEAIILISKRIGPGVSIPAKIFRSFANALMPLFGLGCAKTFLSFVEVGTRFNGMFSQSETKIDYVVVDESGKKTQAFLPLDWRAQWANRIENICHWSLSVSECGSYLWRLQNLSSTDLPPFSTFATWVGRYVSVKTLCYEGWFLYRTWWRQGKHHTVVKVQDGASISKRDIAGSLLKISVAVVCLSLELFAYLVAKGNKSPWLETTLFWSRITPTLMDPVNRYWSVMVTRPYYTAAAAG